MIDTAGLEDIEFLTLKKGRKVASRSSEARATHHNTALTKELQVCALRRAFSVLRRHCAAQMQMQRGDLLRPGSRAAPNGAGCAIGRFGYLRDGCQGRNYALRS